MAKRDLLKVVFAWKHFNSSKGVNRMSTITALDPNIFLSLPYLQISFQTKAQNIIQSLS